MAIAYNAGTASVDGGGTNLTFAHTCSSGSDRLLLVSIHGHTSDVVTSVTYNGVEMTVQKGTNTSRWCYLAYLFNPAQGSNNVVISLSESVGFIQANAWDYTGAPGSTPDASAQDTGDSATPSVSLTTVADNCWVVGAAMMVSGTVTAGASTTGRVTGTVHLSADSGGVVTPPGTRTLNFNGTFASVWIALAYSFSPTAAGGGSTPFVTTLRSRRA